MGTLLDLHIVRELSRSSFPNRNLRNGISELLIFHQSL